MTGDRRYRGILTPSDVAALRGEADLDADAARDARYRVRERVKRAIRDFEVLGRHLPARDRELVMREFYAENGDGSPVMDLLAFLFLGLHDNADAFRDAWDRPAGDYADAVETVLHAGLHAAEWRRGYVSDVRVAVERWRPDRAELVERLDAGWGCLDDIAYLVREYEDTRVLEDVVESGEPLPLVVSREGERIELTPAEAADWLATLDGTAE